MENLLITLLFVSGGLNLTYIGTAIYTGKTRKDMRLLSLLADLIFWPTIIMSVIYFL